MPVPEAGAPAVGMATVTVRPPSSRGRAVAVPPWIAATDALTAQADVGGLAAAVAIGALAGLLPAIRAARLSPTQALWSI
jgi:putative ABC transport system permease protein